MFMLPPGVYRMSELESASASNQVVTLDPIVLQSIADLVSARVEATFEQRLDARDNRVQQDLYVATSA